MSHTGPDPPQPPFRATPQPQPRIGKADHTRAAILNAAIDFVWSRPYREMTVAALMETAASSRSAFYQYFKDLCELMETLLGMLQEEIFNAADPWVTGTGDPVALLNESLAGLVHLCHQRGPFLRAVFDASAIDERIGGAWKHLLREFDDAACARIEADQKLGLIPPFPARTVAIALNRLDAYAVIEAFGQHPRSDPEPVREALARVWVSTLYGREWIEKGSSTLVRGTG